MRGQPKLNDKGSSKSAPSKTEDPNKKRVRKVAAPNSFRLGYLIHDVSRMRRTLYDQTMKSAGVTRSQWWILANISRHKGESIVSSDLAKLLDVGKVTLGGLIDRLEAAGYVYRRPDEKDRRAKQIFITESGYALIAKMRVIAEKLNKLMVVGLSDEQVAEMEANLTIIKDNIRSNLGSAEAKNGKESPRKK